MDSSPNPASSEKPVEKMRNGDVAHENQQSNDEPTNRRDSNNPVMEFEGIVQGEADNNVVQSAGQMSATDEETVKVIQICSANSCFFFFSFDQLFTSVHNLWRETVHISTHIQ